MDNNATVDKYEVQLQQKMQLMQECQSQKGMQSCYNCDDLNVCKTRDDYVKAVYQSMNKGQDGGFEF
jgi:hypothetical protein